MFSAVVVGGGLSGLLMAMHLSRMGGRVQVFERRDVRTLSPSSGRSINLLLSARGLAALREFELEETAKKTICVPVCGRTVHPVSGATKFVPYSDDSSKAIHICSRWGLNKMLLEEAERLPNVTVNFGQQCVGVDPDKGLVTLVQAGTEKRSEVSADFVIGADGTYSAVREHLLRSAPADYEIAALSWCYKELEIWPEYASADGLNRHTTHDWARGGHMLFALPSLDGSFNGVLHLRFRGSESVESLRSKDDVRNFFEHNYADVSRMMPNVVDEFMARRATAFRTVRTSRWHHDDKVVLIGDACHTVVPFYGQGMNAAFEDCSILASCLRAHGNDREAAFAEYAAMRKPNTDALGELSIRHLEELVDPVRHSMVETRHRMSVTLNRLVGLPGTRLYEMFAHTTTPHAECVAEVARQERRARWLGLGIVMACYAVWSGVSHAVRRLYQRRSRLIRHEVGHGS